MLSPDAFGEIPLERPDNLIVCDSCFGKSRLLWCGFVELCLLPRLSCFPSGLKLATGGAFFLDESDARCASSFDSLALDADWAFGLGIQPGGTGAPRWKAAAATENVRPGCMNCWKFVTFSRWL